MALTTLLAELYPDEAPVIVERLQTYLAEPVIPPGYQTDPRWYQSMQLYVTYPEAFDAENKSGFLALADNLTYIKKLGFNAIHVLPFFFSPLVDRGFDISDFTRVRENLGGNEALNVFLDKARQEEMNVFIDLVLNHTSDQHPWFVAAQNGDEHFRRFYITSKEKPFLVRTWEDDQGLWAKYRLGEKEISARIIFPDVASDLPHWREGIDGYWYYHTFYPNQLDLNWSNPDVFLTFMDIIMFWARQHVNFRLDAISFIGKQVDLGIIESSNRTHLIIQAIHKLLEQAAPHTAFLVEACQPVQVTKEYFGNGEVEAELAYNFRLMQSLWASLVSSNNEYIWKALEVTQKLPDWGQWITFMRNHDELTLEFAEVNERLLIYEGLKGNGLPFRAGFGLAGRTASFLGNDRRKLLMSYFLLASLPGVPAMVYGDEIGKGNDIAYMQSQALLRQKVTGNGKALSDTRDVNRGIISFVEKNQPSALQLYVALSNVYLKRLQRKGMATQMPKRFTDVPSDIFAAQYDLNGLQLGVFINLGDEPFQYKVSPLAMPEVAVNYAFLGDERVVLPPFSGLWIRWRKGEDLPKKASI
jgi:maltose alpha-D-glucosyltransferase/alpha-amylase